MKKFLKCFDRAIRDYCKRSWHFARNVVKKIIWDYRLKHNPKYAFNSAPEYGETISMSELENL